MTSAGFCCGYTWQVLSCCTYAPYRKVEQGHMGLVLKFGKYDRKAAPGLTYINPFTEELKVVDTRLVVMDLQRQNVTTSDNLSISIDCVLGYKIVDSNKAIFAVANVQYALQQFCYTTLRHIVGNKTLQECLTSREHIAHECKDLVHAYGATLGVAIDTIGFRDMIVPNHVSEAIASAAIARRSAEAQVIEAEAQIAVARKAAEAKVINAEADVRAAEMMAKAALALNTDAAMQIRLLKTLEDMSKNQGKTQPACPGTRTFVVPVDMSSFTRTLVANSAGHDK